MCTFGEEHDHDHAAELTAPSAGGLSAYDLQNEEAIDNALVVLAKARAEINSHAYQGIDNALERAGNGGGKP